MNQNKRRKSLVHRAIQLALIKRLLLQWVCFAWTTCLASSAVQFFLNPMSVPLGFDVLWGVFLTHCFVSSCLLPMFVYDSVKYSHRFVGPIVRLHRELQRVGSEPVRPIKLRKGDFWHEVADEFNAMLARISQRGKAYAVPTNVLTSVGEQVNCRVDNEDVSERELVAGVGS